MIYFILFFLHNLIEFVIFFSNLKVNLPKFNQRRVSMLKYLGELYNFRMVESSIIFKTLYTLITFGITYDGFIFCCCSCCDLEWFFIANFYSKIKVNELLNSETVLDPIDNYFRVRLICVLLETCGQYFDRGSTKKKLDCFLVYFQVFRTLG